MFITVNIILHKLVIFWVHIELW